MPGDGGGETTWQLGATYAAGDVVSYGGVGYRCIQGHTAYPGSGAAERPRPVAAPVTPPITPSESA
ncbi:hypothetical protein STENM327S_04753 [Streptomyces tendae]